MMVKHVKRSVLERARQRHRGHQEDRETGSLILDILIGMAIFALIALIAISAIGQYRMRTYIQAAVSDAQATAYAVSAAITDSVTGNDTTYPDGYPTGVLDTAMLADLEITPTGKGDTASIIRVTPGIVSPEDFSVCVEYRGAFAVYDMALGGLQKSGDKSKEDFEGCGARQQPPGECPTDPGTDDTYQSVGVSAAVVDQDSRWGLHRYWLPWELNGIWTDGPSGERVAVAVTERVWREEIDQPWWHDGDLSGYTVRQFQESQTGTVWKNGVQVIDDRGEPALGYGGHTNQVLPWHHSANHDPEHKSSRAFTEAEWRAMGEGFDWWHEGDPENWVVSPDGEVLHNGQPVTYEVLVPGTPPGDGCSEPEPVCGPGTGEWFEGTPASTEDLPVRMYDAVYVTVLPWENGVSEAEWREFQQDWWHSGDPENYSIDANGDVLRNGTPVTWQFADFPQWGDYPATGAPRATYPMPWNNGFTREEWREAQGPMFWWHDGDPEAFTVDDDGSVRRDGEPYVISVSTPATDGYWECDGDGGESSD